VKKSCVLVREKLDQIVTSILSILDLVLAVIVVAKLRSTSEIGKSDMVVRFLNGSRAKVLKSK